MVMARSSMGTQLTGNRKKAAPRKPIAKMAKGKRVSKQPKKIAKKTARSRKA
jgi:hypothetical protein